MTRDPLGHYARLGVAPDASPEELKAAFHAQARRLHPDVPGTGDTAAFVRLREAYEVLSNPLRRAAYHRTAAARPPPAPPPSPAPPLSRLPGVWLAAAGAGGVAAIVVLVAVFHSAGPRSAPTPPPAPAAVAQAPSPAPSAPASPPAAPPALAGPPNHYVLPGSGPAVVWQGDAAGHALAPAGRLPDYAPVRVPASPTPAPEGLTPIALAGGGVGYVDAARLMPGDALAARREACADNAGPPTANGDVLALAAKGDARATLANASTSPAVVTLFDSAGRGVVRVYLAPRGAVRLAGLPPGPWTTEIAFGELWSRACSAFVAGERVLRPSAKLPSDGVLTIGPQAPNG
jgi:hypothetical protein